MKKKIGTRPERSGVTDRLTESEGVHSGRLGTACVSDCVRRVYIPWAIRERISFFSLLFWRKNQLAEGTVTCVHPATHKQIFFFLFFFILVYRWINTSFRSGDFLLDLIIFLLYAPSSSECWSVSCNNNLNIYIIIFNVRRRSTQFQIDRKTFIPLLYIYIYIRDGIGWLDSLKWRRGASLLGLKGFFLSLSARRSCVNHAAI